MELVILVGLQGAGKTSFYRAHFAATHAHVSRDLFRNNPNPRRRQTQLVEEAFARGQSVVVDNTNAAPGDRAELIALARTHGARVVGYYFPPDIRGSLARNASREGKARVPPAAVFATRKRLVPPTRAEGFDALHSVEPLPSGEFRVEAAGDAAPPPPGAGGR